MKIRLTTAAAFAALFAVLTAALFTACGDGGSGTSAPAQGKGGLNVAITSSDLAIGPQRFGFVVLEDDVPITRKPMYVRFFRIPAPNNARVVAESTIPWSPLGVGGPAGAPAKGALPNSEITGVYYANLTFDQAGTWGIGVTPGEKLDAAREFRVSFEVAAKPHTVAVGDRGIPVANPTLKDAPLKQIDSSPTKDEAFHQLSIAQALAAGKPALIAFATPAYCTSRTCGPVMDVVAAAAIQFSAKVNFIHVEPYKLDVDGNIVGGIAARQPVEAGEAWRLETEPWVFIVDAKGIVTARFEGPVALEELEFALGQLVTP